MIEKLTKRFQKNARANKSFFCLFFFVFSCCCTVSRFLLLNAAHRQNTHTHTQRTVFFDCMYVIRVCVCVCVCLKREEIFVYPPAFRIYFDRQKKKVRQKKKNNN